ncbi:MAG: DUF222 domain-containing protein [Acidimicrobiales bacterium]
MEQRADRETEAKRLEAEIAEACGELNAAAARLAGLIAQVLETEVWQIPGIHSASQWVAWQCGLSPAHARALVRTASRLHELPQTKTAFDAGELSEDQVAVVCHKAPANIDAEVAQLARSATVAQLRRVLGRYSFADTPTKEPDEEEARRVSFGCDETGKWRLSAVLPADEGAVVERALAEARDELFRAGEHGPGPHPCPADVSWADALVAVAEKSLTAGAVVRPHRDRHLVLLHLDTDGRGHLHLGPGVPDGMRRFLSCDSRVRAVFEEAGRPVSVGRAFRTVPDRTRIVIEERDRGCRVPGCDRSRWLHVHHITHWEDGGATDTANLIALCSTIIDCTTGAAWGSPAMPTIRTA